MRMSGDLHAATAFNPLNEPPIPFWARDLENVELVISNAEIGLPDPYIVAYRLTD
jgi:hypothetical protein